MYAGHVGVALGAFGIRRAVPLWILIVASQLPDWADAAVCLSLRQSSATLLTHSIPAVALLGAAVAIAFWLTSRDVRGAALVLAVVLTHALGDYVTGIKPTWPNGPMVGLQLYRQPALDFVFESAVIALGWLLYRRSFPPEKRSSRGVVAVLVALVLIQLAADIVFFATSGLRKC